MFLVILIGIWSLGFGIYKLQTYVYLSFVTGVLGAGTRYFLLNLRFNIIMNF